MRKSFLVVKELRSGVIISPVDGPVLYQSVVIAHALRYITHDAHRHMGQFFSGGEGGDEPSLPKIFLTAPEKH